VWYTDEKDKDFIRDAEVRDFIGDVGTGVEAEQREEVKEPNVVTPDELVGEAAPQQPDGERAATEQAAKGFMAMLATLFTPQKVDSLEGRETGEHPTDSDKESQIDQVRAMLRYVGATALKVTETPARHILFPNANVGEVPVQIAGYQPTRKRLVIRNVGENSVYLGNSNSITIAEGYELTGSTSEPLEIFAQDAIWAVAAADSERVEMIAEHYS
jgi:hypothetical protein